MCFFLKGSYFIIYNKFRKQLDFNGFNLKSYFLYILDTSISSPPANKRVGRPTKPYTFEQAQNTMAKYHGFYVMVDFYTKYDQKLNFCRKSSTSAVLSPPSKTRRRYNQKKMEEVRLHYPIS